MVMGDNFVPHGVYGFRGADQQGGVAEAGELEGKFAAEAVARASNDCVVQIMVQGSRFKVQGSKFKVSSLKSHITSLKSHVTSLSDSIVFLI